MNNVNANAEAYINSLDTYIDVMKEETAKLSGMIAKLNDKIQEIEAAKEQLIKEQSEPKFTITHDEKYYFVDFYARGCNLNVTSDVYVDVLADRARVNQNNCFKTETRAKEVLDKIKLLLKLERLHDIYCPDYKPDWGSNFSNCYVGYDTSKEKWCSCYVRTMEDAVQVYFPTDEIAQKICDILNSKEQE